ncbi:MAG TPA: hypothetical protein VFI06_03200 [Chitinophagaceae bacterium]|nr:hypothetical protein [Chitinophagaceae bacterium]
MWKVILQSVKATFPLIAGLSALLNSASGQQNIIADKNNTRPEVKEQQMRPARITTVSAIHANGYNEIQWTTLNEEDIRRFIVEASTDGINFQSAGEITPLNGTYTLKHYTFDTRPLLYRIRMENKDGKFYNSGSFLLDGIDISPVKVFPTIVEGNVVNVVAAFPVARVNIVSTNGQQVFAQDMGGISGYTHVRLPALNAGTYVMTSYGNGWQSTSKIIVAR